MEKDIYQRLASHLDGLPGGFPVTESGVELRILRRLFSEEEARLALALSLIAEDARVIARRAGISIGEAAANLENMEKKGLIYGSRAPGKRPLYMAQQFVIGIWEFQVKRLSPEIIQDFQEYLPFLANADIWRKAPQIRVVPVGKAIDTQAEVMTYERAEALIRSQDNFSVAPCICRSEMRMIGHGCAKPLETCLSFGSGADFYVRNGIGRPISREQALVLVRQADQAGLVLSPGNSQEASFICACCGCCCGILRSWKTHDKPAQIVSSPFFASLDRKKCIVCGVCIDRCQMDALRLDDDAVVLDPDRCIGCGLCVTTCPSKALHLQRKSSDRQPKIPKNTVHMALRLGRIRGKLTAGKLLAMVAKSKYDRLFVRNDH